MTHVMIDIETLGTRPGSVILSIGAVAFDPFNGTAFLGDASTDSFYTQVSPTSCQHHGLKIDPETEQWWHSQPHEARNAALGCFLSVRRDPRGHQQFPPKLKDALAALDSWWRTVDGKYIWAHGPGFDLALLEAAYRAIGWREPWRYDAARCTRTIYDLAGVKPDRSQGTHHHALDDAIAQAKAVIDAYHKLGLSRAAREAASAAADHALGLKPGDKAQDAEGRADG